MNKGDGFQAGGCMGESVRMFDEAVKDLGLSVPGSARRLVGQWLEFYARWKGRRVSGFKEPRELAVKLLADSFAIDLAKTKFPGGRRVDVGSGNGWPGLALTALGTDSPVSLLDSREGACDFLNRFLKESGLPGVDVICRRAEEAGREKSLREGFSLTVSRAVSMPGIALELCSGLLAVGGKAVLWLGPGQVVPKNALDLSIFGIAFEELVPYVLPGGMGKRYLAVYGKRRPLDGKFPRRYPAICKMPLI